MDRVARTAPSTDAAPTAAVLDPESREWLDDLRSDGTVRDEAIARLHGLLVRAARFEVGRRQPTMPHLRGNELDDIALEAADDALMSVLRRLDDFRGASRFTTWAYKFGLLEAAVKLRKRAWHGREVPLEPETWSGFASAGLGPEATAEQNELLGVIERAIVAELPPHQRRVLVALALDGVPIEELDRYVELELAGADADTAVPGLRAHLAGCPACREEYASLRALVGGHS